SGPVYQNGYKILELRSGDTFCFTQRSTDGLAGAATTTIKQLPVITTSQHDCVAHAYIPPVRAYDDWSGIKQVKARIPEIGTYVLTYNPVDSCYESHERAALHHRAEPYIIIYEAQDSCHNTSIDTCYILVKDRVRPTAVVDKGITVSLSEKKVWLPAKDFDEGSFDNCEVNLFLVRRSDWYESCIDLCDSIDSICVTTHGDTLWKAYLEPDKDISEVEAHYSKILDWLREDGGSCTNIIYNSWIYDLIKRATQHCVEHPYELTDQRTKEIIDECLPTVMDYFLPVALHPDPYREGDAVDPQEDFRVDDRLLQTYERIGGGWSDAVPFDCTDACGSVTVEILVMDYWCNWSTAWTQVWVEDKVPAKIVKEIEDIDITCKIYRTPRYYLEGQNIPLSIESIIDLAKEKDEVALGALDSIFGGYQKVWKGPYGNYLDEDGNQVADYIPFVDSACYCEIDTIIKRRYFDEHLGYYWKSDTLYDCGYEAVLDTFAHGLVLANCANYVDCKQEIWCEIDHCGEGYIYRKFKIWQGCPTSWYQNSEVPEELKKQHLPDTVTRTQRIRIYNECGLDGHMFDVPPDQELVSCGIQYAGDGSGKVAGAAHPDRTGWLRYRFDDNCRLVGVGYDDKVFKIVGGEAACYKIQRTWYYMDWCEGQPVDDHWYHDVTLDIDSFVQHIFLIDTMPPVCQINGPVEDGGTIEVGDCLFNLRANVEMQDSCGITSYYWGVYRLDSTESPLLIQDYQSKQFALPQTSFDVSVDGLQPGDYKVKAVVKDDCNNEAECLYHFSVLTVKKPTAICITSLTARLNPMDLDQNGIVDTAMVTLWASEYDRSSRVACNDTSLEFRLELKDGIDDDTWQEDADSLQLGCVHTGTEIVRLWVISWPSGTVDYCDLVAIIRSNTGCPAESSDSVFSVMESQTELQTSMPGNQMKKSHDDPFLDIEIPLKLVQEAPDIAEEIQLLQNYPNPFSSETIISFNLPKNMEADIIIYNINGQILKSIHGQFVNGVNQISVSRDLFSVGGIYYYQLRTSDYQNTKRMVFIR
ncbi:MAG: T9SS type A sorting domain-containing protein, partial [Saprospiraceae bacterium]|nr:T9SS type A sorting domain-containing protein [Saprospiraceae bacterium]